MQNHDTSGNSALAASAGQKIGWLAFSQTTRRWIDFLCAKAKLVIEVDGSIHNQQVEYDAERTAWLENERGYRVIRFTNQAVLTDIEGVLNRIREALRE